jgi:mRNA interferase RelE/StbE
VSWSIDFEKEALKQFKKIDRNWQGIILDTLEDEISQLDNPRKQWKALVGNRQGLWRYRIGDYRVICEIQEKILTIAVVRVGHRKDVYD